MASSPLTFTNVAEIPQIVTGVRKAFDSQKTKSMKWRREQLLAINNMIIKKENEIIGALSKDHHRQDASFSYLQEIISTRNEIVHALENLDDWTATEYPPKPALNATDRCEVRHEPLGVVLIIGPWNYPFHLTILPLVSAIAAGNAVVIKTTAVLEQRFDHIFYTGNGVVGRIIMKAAAKYLTPVTLELGGKSPVYVHEDANLENAARRVFWAKTNNSGQTCIAPDYLLVHKKAVPGFISGFKKAYTEFYGSDAQKSPLFSRVINRHHFNRLNTILERQKACPKSNIVLGGRADADDLYIEPTLVTGVSTADPIMEDELFGPLISLIEVQDEEEAIAIITARDHPLALYIFSDNTKVINKILDRTNSGAAIVNDLLMNMIVPELPFGGVGPSGMGAYHGKTMEIVNEVRYPKFSSSATGRKLLTSKWKLGKRFGFVAALVAAFLLGGRVAGVARG
ncbi:aldehyde dehydrogenase, dimeric NADP-preferring [Chytridium lagenaria]|nr:aldehyde dehydrogenase, dimeric NADP-preferring [Chytridium lagenaria]